MEIKNKPSDFEFAYKGLIYEISRRGISKSSRAGDTLFLPNRILTFDAASGKVPVITGKKIFAKKAIAEATWMFRGRTDLDFLHKAKINWWDEFLESDGTLGKTYGYQVRKWNNHLDQIEYCKKQLRSNSRRAVLNFWNTEDAESMQLPPCYTSMTFIRDPERKKVHMTFVLRSSDSFLGLPYDLIIGWYFLKEIARSLECYMGEIMYVLSDCHIYKNHINQINLYLSRPHYGLPTFKQIKTISKHISTYKTGPFINAKLNN